MQDRFTTRHRKLIASFLIAIAALACLFAVVIAATEGLKSAVPPIHVACLFCFNCVGFLTGWLFRDGR
jgi:hypothetical protein